MDKDTRDKILAWGFIGLVLFWILDPFNIWRIPTGRQKVFACPNDDNSSKCYELEADIERECDTSDDRTDCYTYVSTLFFNNGGNIDFDSCDVEGKTFFCTEYERSKEWKISLRKE